MISPMQSIPEELVVERELLPGGNHWSLLLKRGFTLRLTDLQGGANVSALLYNRDDVSERYNMADTLKAQHIAALSKGCVCYSDMGRILVSIPEETAGWHDTICGVTDARLIAEKYGQHDYQDHRNDYYRNGRDSFLMQLGRRGLGKRDIVPNLNFFSKATVDDVESGALRYVPNNSKPGDFIDLRAEMNVLIVFNSCPHPLNPAPEYPLRPVEWTIWRSGIGGGPGDPCRLSRPENGRGYENTFAYFAQEAFCS